MIEVDPDDPAFQDPTKFIGPVYERDGGRARWPPRRAGRSSPTATSGGASSRRRARSGSSRSGRSAGCSRRAPSSICTGGGGIPTMYEPGTEAPVGAEVVIDKDRASALLAEQLDADLFVMATDVEAVYTGLGDAAAGARSRTTTPDELSRHGPARRVDGAQGRGGGGVRSQDRQAGGDRDARPAPRRRRRDQGYAGRPRARRGGRYAGLTSPSARPGRRRTAADGLGRAVVGSAQSRFVRPARSGFRPCGGRGRSCAVCLRSWRCSGPER